MVEVHIGKTAWSRVRRVPLDVLGTPHVRPDRPAVRYGLEGKWWGGMGFPLVAVLDGQTTVTDYDFTCLDRLYVLLDATDCSYPTARDCARRICEHGAARVILMHPMASPGGGYEGWDVYVGAPR